MRLELLHAHVQILLAECRKESSGTESAIEVCVSASQPHGLLSTSHPAAVLRRIGVTTGRSTKTKHAYGRNSRPRYVYSKHMRSFPWFPCFE